jgi:hypothetical protein
MAVGFSESYIRLWNLKGEKLRGLRNDIDPSAIKDGELQFPCLSYALVLTILS